MKKLILLSILTLSIVSCSLDDGFNAPEFNLVLVPIDSVQMPDTLTYGETYDFEVIYQRPTNCHDFYAFDYAREENERYVGIVNSVLAESENCEELTNEWVTKELEFLVERNDYYIFNFWQGEDENGEAIYLTKEVPVVPVEEAN